MGAIEVIITLLLAGSLQEEVPNVCNGQSIGSTPSDIMCGVSGVCEGLLIHTEDATTTAACQDACANFSGCSYYTHDPAADKCLMFETCPSLDEDFCPECISGSPGCEIENGEGKIESKHNHSDKTFIQRVLHPGRWWHWGINIS